MAVALAWLLAAPLLLEGVGIGEYVLQPAEYASPSGAVVLRVDPLDRPGLQGARYELSRNGTLVWKGELDLALRAPAVTDDGRVAGFGFKRDKRLWYDARFLVLDPRGDVRADHAIEGTLEPGCDSVWITPAATFAQPELERWVLLHGEGERGVVWQAFDLESGAVLSERIPIGCFPEGRRYTFQSAHAIPGTPLILATVHQRARPRAGEIPAIDRLRHVVFDQDRQCVWSMEQLHGFPEYGTLVDREFWDSGTVLRVGMRRFDLWNVDAATHVELRVVPQDGTWSIRPRRTDFHRIADPLDYVESLDLPEPARVELETDELEGGLAGAALTPGGGVLLLARHNDGLRLVDSSGTAQWSAHVRRSDGLLSISRWPRRLVWGRNGDLFARARGGFQHFAPNGKLIETVDAPPPEGPIPWRFEKRAIERLGDDPEPVRRLERRPDGKWFGSIVASTIAQDGTAVALDVAAMVATPPTPTTVSVLGWRGEYCVELPFVPHARPDKVQATEHWILVSTDTRHAFLVRRADRALLRVEAPEVPGELLSWEFGLTDGDGELHALAYQPGGHAVLFRWALGS